MESRRPVPSQCAHFPAPMHASRFASSLRPVASHVRHRPVRLRARQMFRCCLKSELYVLAFRRYMPDTLLMLRSTIDLEVKNVFSDHESLVGGLLFFASFRTIATATFLIKDVPQQNGPVAKGHAGCAIQMLSDTQGVNFNSYLRDVYLSVRKCWFANMPPSVEKGQQVNE